MNRGNMEDASTARGRGKRDLPPSKYVAGVSVALKLIASRMKTFFNSSVKSIRM